MEIEIKQLKYIFGLDVFEEIKKSFNEEEFFKCAFQPIRRLKYTNQWKLLKFYMV
jgi:hypothetical protein